jgi:threonine/homoserine/homoserine lactone efflux protein
MNSFDSIILILLGIIGLYMAITNKKTTMWSSTRGDRLGRKISEAGYARIVNLLIGILCLAAGVFIFLKSK